MSWMHPLSMSKKLTILILISYILPIVSMVSLLQQFIADQFDQQLTEKVELSLEETTGLAITYLESMIESSRRLTYDGSVDSAYDQYLIHGNTEELFRWAESSLNGTYKYNSLFLSAALFYHDTTLPSHLVVNDNARTSEEVEEMYFEKEEEIRSISSTLDAYIGFYSEENRLFLIRNLLNDRFQQYGVLVLEVDIGRVLGAFQGMTGFHSVEVYFDDAVVRQALYAYRMGLTTMTSERSVERHRMHVVLEVDTNQGQEVLEKLTERIATISLLIVPALGYMLYTFYRHITQPLMVLLEAQKKVERGYLGFQMEEVPTTQEFQALALGFNAMSRSMKEQFQQSYQEQLALQDARMKTLQSQINPHFLNNTLEIINWETRIAGNSSASAMIEALSVMLGATMDREGKGKIPFHQELTYVDAYLYIQSCRLGARLTIEKNIAPDTLNVLVPRLAFQPIVENAFEHGVSAQRHGHITISSFFRHGILMLEVKNSGKMTKEDEVRIKNLLEWDDSTQDYTIDSPSLGVRNVNQRVKLMYGQSYGLEVSTEGEETVARLALPVERGF